MTQASLVWHYTTSERIFLIVGDERLTPATARIDPGERPAVWFTIRETYEPTAIKSIRENGAVRLGTMADMIRIGGLYRIGVEAAAVPLNWRYHTTKGGISKRSVRGLERAAKECGSDPNEWRVHYGDVPSSAWRAIQASADGSTWSDAEDFAVFLTARPTDSE